MPLGECRCGAPRAAAAGAAVRMRQRSEKLPRDVTVLLVVLALLVVGGMAALFFPYSHQKSLRLLGTLDQSRPMPTATPARR